MKVKATSSVSMTLCSRIMLANRHSVFPIILGMVPVSAALGKLALFLVSLGISLT